MKKVNVGKILKFVFMFATVGVVGMLLYALYQKIFNPIPSELQERNEEISSQNAIIREESNVPDSRKLELDSLADSFYYHMDGAYENEIEAGAVLYELRGNDEMEYFLATFDLRAPSLNWGAPDWSFDDRKYDVRWWCIKGFSQAERDAVDSGLFLRDIDWQITN